MQLPMYVAYLKSKKGVVSVEHMLEVAGFEGVAPILPAEIIHWKEMLEQKK